MSKLKAYDQVLVKQLKKLSGVGDRFNARGTFVKEVVRGEFKGMAIVRIGNTEIHVPFSKVEKIGDKDES